MRPGTVVHLGGAALIATALAVWAATGREGFTRWPDQRLAQSDASPAPGESELLAEAGFTNPAQAHPDIQSRFALGLVPGGENPAHLLSVAMAIGLAVAASSVVIAARLIQRRGRHHLGQAPTPGEQP